MLCWSFVAKGGSKRRQDNFWVAAFRNVLVESDAKESFDQSHLSSIQITFGIDTSPVPPTEDINNLPIVGDRERNFYMGHF